MGHVIPLGGAEHAEAQLLLPWYMTRQLEPGEAGLVEAHLETCAECRAELDSERLLRTGLASASPEADRGWEKLAARLQPQPWPRKRLRSRAAGVGGAISRSSTVKRMVAAQMVFILLLGGLAFYPRQQAAPYRTLGDAPAAHHGNALLMFAPSTTESELRRLLNASNARLVGGPTTTNGYLVEIPSSSRDRDLARLRADPAVVMAQPVDASSAR